MKKLNKNTVEGTGILNISINHHTSTMNIDVSSDMWEKAQSFIDFWMCDPEDTPAHESMEEYYDNQPKEADDNEGYDEIDQNHKD